MAKIYCRKGLIKNTVPKKKNEKNRKRNIIQNFRVTEEERRQIRKRIELSGLPKAEFFLQSCLHQKIETVGNVRTFQAIRQQMETIDAHLISLSSVEELDYEILESLRTILEILDGQSSS